MSFITKVCNEFMKFPKLQGTIIVYYTRLRSDVVHYIYWASMTV